jgi:MurNAc alpha-1-phosphate uridylyltransferase
MRAMILAAGKGARMCELTQTVPKPLLTVNGRYLIEYSLIALAKANIQDVLINTHYHAEQLRAALGNGRQYHLNISYSDEPVLLDTGGGIVKALPFFKGEPFIVTSADIVTDFAFETLCKLSTPAAHLVYVPNPYFKVQGDVSLTDPKQRSIVLPATGKTFTYASFGLFHPDLFQHSSDEPFPLNHLFLAAIQAKTLTGEVYNGYWQNVGTPQELALAEKQLALKSISS